MKTNMGKIDRILRAILGIGLISLAFVGLQTPWGWIGVVPLVIAFMGWCPAYLPFGISTCPKQHTA
jgi:predicted small integral membrane protein